MGREAFLTMYRGQKWTMAMYCAGQPIQWEDNQSPVFTTSFPQESYNKNRKTDLSPTAPASKYGKYFWSFFIIVVDS